MEKSKFQTIIIIFLLILNLGTLTFLFIRRPMGPPPGMQHRGPNPGEFIVRELNFDESQKTQFDKLKAEHQQQMRNLRDSIEVERMRLPDVIVNTNDSMAIDASTKIGRYQQQVEWFTYQHFVKVYGICNDNQKGKFAGIIGEVLHMMAPPKQGPPGPH